MLEPTCTGLGEPTVKDSGILKSCCQTLGSLVALNWIASVGAFTPQKVAYAINQAFFFVTASLPVHLPVLLCSKLPVY